VAVPVSPGSYTAGETLLPGYTFDGFSGDCDTNGATTVALGESKTCTLTNTEVEQVAQIGVLFPTQTTCEMYRDNQAPAMYPAFTYQVKKGKINSMSPGVFFYYNTITWPATGTVEVFETNTAGWFPMLYQAGGQAILYNYDCSKSGITGVGSISGSDYTVTFTGAAPSTTYIIGIKYSPRNVIGQPVDLNPDTGYPESIYTWKTTFGGAGQPGTTGSIPLQSKK